MANQLPEPIMVSQENPDYTAFQLSIVVVKEGASIPAWPIDLRGVATEPTTEYLYVTDLQNHLIHIFSKTGDHINHFGNSHLLNPWGILIHQDNIYITDQGHNAIFLFSLPNLEMRKKVGMEGFGRREFRYPGQLAISPNQHLYVADLLNNRIQILTTTLEFTDTIRHRSMNHPVDVKFSANEIYVLSCIDSPCVHVFTLTGEKTRSIVTRGKGMQVWCGLFFCLDRHNNILISDSLTHNIKVFSQEGDLLHTMGQKEHDIGMFDKPYSVTLLNNNKLICNNSRFDICIYFATNN